MDAARARAFHLSGFHLLLFHGFPFHFPQDGRSKSEESTTPSLKLMQSPPLIFRRLTAAVLCMALLIQAKFVTYDMVAGRPYEVSLPFFRLHILDDENNKLNVKRKLVLMCKFVDTKK